MRELRGNDIAIVFQEPMTSLNPIYTIGNQLIEPLVLHLGMTRQAGKKRAIELLAGVGVPFPAQRIGASPHELSGGWCQRAMIAMALTCSPKILIADEPTTLDVTIRPQILDLLAELKAETDMAVILITHDLGVVAELADRVAVMYAGRTLEEPPVGPFYNHPDLRAADLRRACPGAGAQGRLYPALRLCRPKAAGEGGLWVIPTGSGSPWSWRKGLVKHSPTGGGLLARHHGSIRAVDGIDLAVRRGETLGLVGKAAVASRPPGAF